MAIDAAIIPICAISPRVAFRVPCLQATSSNFVPHDTGQLCFGVRLQNQAGIHKEEAARQCEGVYLLAIQHLDGERHLGVGVPDQVLAYAIHILPYNGVGNDFGLTLHFLGQLLAKSDFPLQGIEVDTFANLPIANRVRVILGILLSSPAKTPHDRAAKIVKTATDLHIIARNLQDTTAALTSYGNAPGGAPTIARGNPVSRRAN